MTTIPSKFLLVSSLGLILTLSGCAVAGTADKAALPSTTPDGLALVPNSKADAVYRRPGINLAGYTQVALLDPKVSFRTNWQSDTNHNRMGNRIEDEQVRDMIATGEKLLTEEFTEELTKNGYSVVKIAAPNVLAVRVSIVDLDVFAPDSNGGMTSVWSNTYSDGTGSATLVVELYDSVTQQLLVRAYDHATDEGTAGSRIGPKSQTTNIRDARFVINDWAKMLVKGLNRAKEAPAP